MGLILTLTHFIFFSPSHPNPHPFGEEPRPLSRPTTVRPARAAAGDPRRPPPSHRRRRARRFLHAYAIFLARRQSHPDPLSSATPPPAVGEIHAVARRPTPVMLAHDPSSPSPAAAAPRSRDHRTTPARLHCPNLWPPPENASAVAVGHDRRHHGFQLLLQLLFLSSGRAGSCRRRRLRGAREHGKVAREPGGNKIRGGRRDVRRRPERRSRGWRSGEVATARARRRGSRRCARARRT